ncbi:Response regulator receiver domain-containing protein [Marinitoga hydrogenitolerans DSM 16785]|uniref:Response regulator receiver domain-containing protein n=1 Tax=Marinitoga hydrogenitolerans (strain DSM 16785 / JCM 12826 / AT1271) TaxID=1122195 RepID=A0A1M4UK24_MARH1|nr:response regulator [Marinitoga hydrogenitolerans]SHE56913.1 Response regulator receiver domain-containing protein [Marinitoga hydrogenitolerans DSM 16785]
MKWKIMIVDDEFTSREFLKEYILNIVNDVEIFQAENADNGLKMLNERKAIHIIFLDIMMPGMDSFEFLNKIKELNPLIQVIIVTAHNNYDNIIKAIKNGADDYIIKPFSIDDVKDVLEYSIRKLHRWKHVLNNTL